MAITALEARTQILDDLAAAVDHAALAVAALGEAFEQLPDAAGERLEAALFRPAQRAYARGKRTHAGFAERTALATRAFELPSPGLSSQGVSSLVERAVAAAAAADARLAELQDSMLPVESGDAGPARRSQRDARAARRGARQRARVPADARPLAGLHPEVVGSMPTPAAFRQALSQHIARWSRFSVRRGAPTCWGPLQGTDSALILLVVRMR